MGGACGRRGIEEKCMYVLGNPKEGDQLEDLSTDGRVILKWI